MLTFAATALLFACGSGQSLRLRHVVLYQNGIGYFERSGRADGDVLRLKLRAHEVDDVMKTLTVIGEDGASASSAVVPEPAPEPEPREDDDDETDEAPPDLDETTTVDVHLGGSGRALTVTYAVPTPAWRAVYRVVLPEEGDEALLQAWAVVYNASGEDWDDVQLTLATGAPFTYAVDLRSPQFVARPDITGEMVMPVVRGPVRSTQTRGRDHDAIPDSEDQCPTEDEDMDGFEDSDGCPDPDNDQDRILDVDDQCPNEMETYNGYEDEDGCPDRGRVVIQDTAVTILDKVYFTNRGSDVRERSLPIIDAIAATLQGNPQITSVVIEGHAARNERGGWALSAARAEAVRDALVSRGVSASRLQTRPFGSTQPVDPRNEADAHERNRRVEFEIAAMTEDEPDTGGGAPSDGRAAAPSGPRPVTVETMERSARAMTLPSDVSTGTAYTMARSVTIPAGSSTLVPILNQRVPGRDVLFYRPDDATPESDLHPFRAARVENTSGMSLVPGTVALYARGTFVGEGVLDAVHVGENTLVPYVVDGSTTVLARTSAERRPNRLVSIARGVVTVEDWQVSQTHYEIRVGRHSPDEILLSHRVQYGYELVDPPPGVEESGATTLIPVPLHPGQDSEVVLEERRATERRVGIVDDLSTVLDAYVHPDDLEPALRDQLTEVLTKRRALGELEEQLRDVREQSAVASQRLSELQASLRSIERSGASAAELRRQLQTRLRDATTQSESLTTRLADLTAQRAEARVRLTELVSDLSMRAPAE